MKKLLLATALLISTLLQAQNRTISGYITDAATGEVLIGANVFDANTVKGTVANTYGFYSLTLPQGKVKYTVSFVGYQTWQQEITLTRDTIISIKLEESVVLDEVTIVEKRMDDKVQSTQMGQIDVPIETIKNIPMLLGEVDIIKAIQLLPGVKGGQEGSSGMYVRGGGPDQNLILLDGVPVYNVNHLFGFFSVFNSDAINNVKLVKGGFPARYGGRLSSVLDISMKEGNNKRLKGTGSIGLISSNLTLEGPIMNEKTTFIVSARRTYIDILMQPFIRAVAAASSEGEGSGTFGYFFYDFNTKINHRFDDRNRLYLSVYAGRDKAYGRVNEEFMDIDAALYWGNVTSALRWNHMFSPKLFANTTLTYTKYQFVIDVTAISENDNISITESAGVNSGINDWAAKIDFDYIPTTSHYIRFGASETFHTFRPQVTSVMVKAELEDTTIEWLDRRGADKVFAHELDTYIEDDWNINRFLKLNVGLHASGFQVSDSTGNSKFYPSLQPRIASRFLFNSKWSVKAAYTQMQQYIHLLSYSAGFLGLPNDLWVPVTKRIPPQKSSQYAAGVFYNLTNQIELSIEGYYKTMNQLIEYKEGAKISLEDESWQDQVTQVRGWAYGGEFLVQKTQGKLTGWIGYTLSWTYRQGDRVNRGRTFFHRYDRRHDISIVATYKINDKIDFGATWVYGTGNAITLPNEKYIPLAHVINNNPYYSDDQNIKYFSERNGHRMGSYHRLDAGINFNKKVKWFNKYDGERTWNIGVYNAYNRKNPFSEYFSNSDKKFKRISLFPIIPSFSYKFKF